jgi:hypothetical protein
VMVDGDVDSQSPFRCTAGRQIQNLMGVALLLPALPPQAPLMAACPEPFHDPHIRSP